MKHLVLVAALAVASFGQQTVRWFATTGDQVLAGAGTSATIQQLATNGSQALIDQVVIYCSVACNVTFTANGTAATATAGTVTPLLPSPLNAVILLGFWTSSNVGAGTSQGGIVHVPAGSSVPVCFSPTCGAATQYQFGPGGGTGSNFTVTVASITGTVNFTLFGRSVL